MINFYEHKFRFIAGWALIILGIAGLFLPILQGTLFIITGLLMLEIEHIVKIIRKMDKRWHERKR